MRAARSPSGLGRFPFKEEVRGSNPLRATRERLIDMTNRTSTLLTALIGEVCGLVIIRSFLFADSMTVRIHLVQGFFVCAGLGLVAVEILARIKATKANGRIT